MADKASHLSGYPQNITSAGGGVRGSAKTLIIEDNSTMFIIHPNCGPGRNAPWIKISCPAGGTTLLVEYSGGANPEGTADVTVSKNTTANYTPDVSLVV